jgi:hypothetical protein
MSNSSTSGMNSKNNNSHNTSPKQTDGLMWILSLGKRMGFAVFVGKVTTVTSKQCTTYDDIILYVFKH